MMHALCHALSRICPLKCGCKYSMLDRRRIELALIMDGINGCVVFKTITETKSETKQSVPKPRN